MHEFIIHWNNIYPKRLHQEKYVNSIVVSNCQAWYSSLFRRTLRFLGSWQREGRKFHISSHFHPFYPALNTRVRFHISKIRTRSSIVRFNKSCIYSVWHAGNVQLRISIWNPNLRATDGRTIRKRKSGIRIKKKRRRGGERKNDGKKKWEKKKEMSVWFEPVYIRTLDMNNSIGLGPYSKDAFVHMLRYTRPVRGFATANCVHRTISTGNKIRDTDGAWLHSATLTCIASIYIGPRYF